jgi:UDP-N-acetylmuramate dehydrogenase
MMTAEQQDSLRGVLTEQEPMSRHTSWRVGGPADRFYQPADLQDLALFLSRLAADEPLMFIGLGSNLLVRDGGVRGTVIMLTGLLEEMQQLDGNRVRLQAGVTCAKAARFCARCGLVGAEFLAGIPGTLGGALAMNAGCFGGDTWSLVQSVETIDRSGNIHQRRPQEFSIEYREVTGHAGEWFVSATLQLEPGDSDAAQRKIRELLALRGETQPTNQPSCGSVFRNPPDNYAAKLIEACGLKGKCIGGACVSEKHANFIVNSGHASASDIEQLIADVASTVQREKGITLQPEVHVIGEQATGKHDGATD